MCLLKPRLVQITKDITCYKIVTPKLNSFFFEFPYELGKTYKLEKDMVILFPKNITPDNMLTRFPKINQGFHSFKEPIPLPLYNLSTLVECTIPKDSVVYEGIDCEDRPCWVSNQIRIDKIITSNC